MEESSGLKLSRRETPACAQPAAEEPASVARATFAVDGERRSPDLDTRTTWLDALREHLHLTGTKKRRDQGQCGACTVLVDGRRVVSCLSLALTHEGAAITAVKGLGSAAADGYQRGYCTPGQICSAVGVLEEIERGVPSHVSAGIRVQPLRSADELRERMSGNICRCGAYSNIVNAITEVAGARA